MYFSINREMLRNETTINGHVAALGTPFDRDRRPFAKIGDRDVCPSDAAITIRELADLCSMPAIELAEVIASSLKGLTPDDFCLSGLADIAVQEKARGSGLARTP
jgi:hypothetical protein